MNTPTTASMLTADFNSVSQGVYRLAGFPLVDPASGSVPFVGSFVYLDASGNLNAISGSTTASALCIGQVCAMNTAMLAAENIAIVRYNGVFEANFLSGASLVNGANAYLASDNQVTHTTGSVLLGVYIGTSPDGNALVSQAI